MHRVKGNLRRPRGSVARSRALAVNRSAIFVDKLRFDNALGVQRVDPREVPGARLTGGESKHAAHVCFGSHGDVTEAIRGGGWTRAEVSLYGRRRHAELAQQLTRGSVAVVTGTEYVFVHQLATALVDGDVPPELAGRRLLLVGDQPSQWQQLRDDTEELAAERALVVISESRLDLATTESAASAGLAALFAQSDLAVAIVALQGQPRYEETRQMWVDEREFASAGRVAFCIRVIQAGVDAQKLFFSIPHGEARELCMSVHDAGRRSGVADPLAHMPADLVKAFRAGEHRTASNHFHLGSYALATFAAGLPIRVGWHHLLTLVASGQRFRVHRACFPTSNAFLAAADAPAPFGR